MQIYRAYNHLEGEGVILEKNVSSTTPLKIEKYLLGAIFSHVNWELRVDIFN